MEELERTVQFVAVARSLSSFGGKQTHGGGQGRLSRGKITEGGFVVQLGSFWCVENSLHKASAVLCPTNRPNCFPLGTVRGNRRQINRPATDNHRGRTGSFVINIYIYSYIYSESSSHACSFCCATVPALSKSNYEMRFENDVKHAIRGNAVLLQCPVP